MDTADGCHSLAKVRVASSNLVIRSNEPLVGRRLAGGSCVPAAHGAHADAHGSLRADQHGAMQGSIRQRGACSWELRVFVGTDPDTGRRIDRTATSRGTREHAELELELMVASVGSTRSIGLRSPMSELLEAWFAIAETGWAPTTIHQTRSVLNRYLHPHLGHVAAGDIPLAAIDAVYVQLRRRGGVGGKPLAAGTLARVHVVCAPASAKQCGGVGSGTTRLNAPTESSPFRGSCIRPRLPSCAHFSSRSQPVIRTCTRC
jgi:hypothetical protein